MIWRTSAICATGCWSPVSGVGPSWDRLCCWRLLHGAPAGCRASSFDAGAAGRAGGSSHTAARVEAASVIVAPHSPWLAGSPSKTQTQQQQQPKSRPLAATLARAAPEAAALPLAPPQFAKPPSAVALQPVGAPAASPFSAACLQTPLAEAPQPARRTRPRLSSASSAPAPGASSEQALSWVLAMGKIAESQGVAATPPPLACPWELPALPSRPPSPPSARHVADAPAPRPTHSSRSLEHSSSGSVAAENASPVVCTADKPGDRCAGLGFGCLAVQ